MTDVGSQKRVLTSLTAKTEKRILIWLAERMPRWVTPDLLTGVGVLGAAIVFAGYALSNLAPGFLWLSTFGLIVNWFGDSVDGTLARVRGTERPKYGFYIDHTVDVISEGFVILGIGVSPYVRFDVACLTFIGYLSISVLSYVRAFVDGTFKISYGWFGPTELRILLAVVNTIMFFAPRPTIEIAGVAAAVYDLAVAAIALGLAAAFLFSTLKGLRELEHADA